MAILAILALVWFFVLRGGSAGGDEGGASDVNVEVDPGGGDAAE